MSNLEWFWKKFVAKELLTKKLKKKTDRIADENTFVVVSKPAINLNIFDSVSNLQTDEILHADLYKNVLTVQNSTYHLKYYTKVNE